MTTSNGMPPMDSFDVTIDGVTYEERALYDDLALNTALGRSEYGDPIDPEHFPDTVHVKHVTHWPMFPPLSSHANIEALMREMDIEEATVLTAFKGKESFTVAISACDVIDSEDAWNAVNRCGMTYPYFTEYARVQILSFSPSGRAQRVTINKKYALEPLP